ncbi:MAG: hypothetical protein V5A46_02390 [Haloferacaceae archaeon]
MGSLVPLLTAGAVGTAALYRGTRPVAAVGGSGGSGFEAADAPVVEHNDGRVTSVTVAPEVDLDWRNFGAGVAGVDVRLGASVDDAMDVLADATLSPGDPASAAPIATVEGSFADVDGTLSVSFETLDLVEIGDAVTADTFTEPSLQASETATTAVELLLGVDVRGNEGELAEAVETATFDVTVRNPDGEAGFEAKANPDAA